MYVNLSSSFLSSSVNNLRALDSLRTNTTPSSFFSLKSNLQSNKFIQKIEKTLNSGAYDVFQTTASLQQTHNIPFSINNKSVSVMSSMYRCKYISGETFSCKIGFESHSLWKYIASVNLSVEMRITVYFVQNKLDKVVII